MRRRGHEGGQVRQTFDHAARPDIQRLLGRMGGLLCRDVPAGGGGRGFDRDAALFQLALDEPGNAVDRHFRQAENLFLIHRDIVALFNHLREFSEGQRIHPRVHQVHRVKDRRAAERGVDAHGGFHKETAHRKDLRACGIFPRGL